MTRINLVEPAILTKRHLVAEYKELTQILYPMIRAAKKGTQYCDIPPQFCLNGGHVKFFYNKGVYLEKRFKSLYEECLRRGINAGDDLFRERISRIRESFPKEWKSDYVPQDVDYAVVVSRIWQRINEKPDLYPDKNVFIDGIKSMKEAGVITFDL